MIRIVHVISDLDMGGAEVMLAKLVGGMDRRRFANTVVSLMDFGILGKEIEASGTVVSSSDMTRGRIDARAIFRLGGILKAIRPTLVQS
ncbi:MAG: hypothetical protein AB1555_17460 [Nitrospirota bacterium]